MADPLDPPPLASDPLDPSLAATLAANLTDTATIQRKTAASAGAGGVRDTWSTLATCACGIVSQTQWTEGVQGGEIRAITVWKAQFPVGQDVKARDRVVIGANTWEVVGTDAGLSGAPLLTAELKRLEK